jgi:hypothetical protein
VVHWTIGIVCGGLVLVVLAALLSYDTPRAQRLLVANNFESADCRIEFSDGSRVKFRIARAGAYKRTFKAPKPGFATMRCRTVSKLLESPASFHLRDGQLATLTINPQGVAELTYSPISK